MTVQEMLKTRGQEHLLKFYADLSAEEQISLLKQIEEMDWSMLDSPLYEQDEGEISPLEGYSLAEIKARQKEFFETGAKALCANKVAAVLLAGGQGSRLGFNGPKGAYNVGITRPLYIFEQLICNLKEVCAACGCTVPLLIMTSGKNDGETRAFFEEHGYFGYPKEAVRFFMQEMAPSVDFEGKILLEGKGKVALSPNGNGGWYSSLVRAGLLKDVLLKDVEWFNVFAVDNVLQRIADPVFVGATILSGRNCGAKAVRKASPEERVGVLCLKNKKPDVIEYYEISKELASLRKENGELVYSYGVILNYLFRAETLKEIASEKISVHRAKKKISCIDGEGNPVWPEKENGYKFETLILDMVRLCGTCLPFEVVREREFAPIKNQTGVDSVESARELLTKNGVKL